jgi:hypothetical protein
MKPPDVGGLLRALGEGEVEYVLIGGVAVAAHGPVRATEDVDLVPNPNPENLRRLGNVLVSLGACMSGDPDRAFGAEQRTALAQGRNLTLETALGGIDIVQRMPGMPGFDALRDQALVMELLGATVQVCGRDHLREMKLARGSHRDMADVEDLDALGR